MAVVGVLVEAVVGHEHERVADLVAQVAQRDLHDAVGVVGARAARRPSWPGRRRGSPPGTPRSASARTSLRRLSWVCWTTPGIDTTGSGASMPSFTNSGATRSSTDEAGLGDEAAQRGGPAQPAQAAVRGTSRHRWLPPTVLASSELRAASVAPNATSSAATSPSMVCRSASASTREAALDARWREVTGPIDTTSGCGSGSGADQRRRSSSTVDDDVNVIASTSPARTRASVVGVGLGAARCGTRAGRRPRSPAPRRPSGSTSRACSARARSTRSPRRPAARERLEQRLGDEALGHEVGADARARRARRRSRARSRRPARRASARASSPAAASPRSKNASTPLADVKTSHAYAPSVGQRELDRLDRDGRELDHLGPERLEPRPQLARLLAGAGDDDACGRTAAATRTRRGRAPATSPTTIALGARTPASATVASVARIGALLGPGASAHRGDRRVRRRARRRSGARRCRRGGPRP